MDLPQRPFTILISALGGEGGGVLADWLVATAEQNGYFAQTTSVPGVAQRTGATIYYVELFPADAGMAQGMPVLALMPVPGQVDIVLASELMEAGRAIQRGLVTPDRTTLIASTHRAYSIAERAAMGDGRVDSRQLIDAGMTAAKRFIRADFAQLAQKSGSVVSAALFGALAGARILPFARDRFESTIRRAGVGVESSLKAFAAGFDSVSRPPDVQDGAIRPQIKLGPALAGFADRIEREFPPALREVLLAGVVRLADYQDPDYAALALDRLQPIAGLDREHGDGETRLLTATARHLVAWMSYEDAVRVADLKIRRSRFERVAREVGCQETQLLEIEEFMHPRAEEIADILPVAIGRWLLSSPAARRLLERGGRVVKTTALRHFLLLYAIAALRPLRRKSLRFEVEQQRITAWLETIESLASENYGLALAATECQRLIKGYGDTHHRGSANFDAVLWALPRIRMQHDPASSMRDLICAALADDSGQKLAFALRNL